MTPRGLNEDIVDKTKVNKLVKQLAENNPNYATPDEDEIKEIQWEEELLKIIKEIKPDAFERLCQRILRESGFTEVSVEGRSGDGGIDGRGIYKIGGLISIRVIFQSKRYKGSVSSQEIREFKGTMAGRAEKGLFITTGTFTRDARTEAIRDGAAPIDLVDGLALAEILKNLNLGIITEHLEEVRIDKTWYELI